MLWRLGTLELECDLRLSVILALIARSGDGVGHDEVHIDRNVRVQADFHGEGVGQGTQGEFGGAICTMTSHRESGEDGAGEYDVLC